mmetsp:Transcript_18988/g.30708  ORF Transcript_18988/g.30708 Transcript_18988/m.30708 type:complete len:373 (-) Transcript_18988:2530-3648(-)
MDSMRHDLCGVPEESHPEVVEASATAKEQTRSLLRLACSKCRSFPPAQGDKLRYCGRCGEKAYCSKRCAKADWSEHMRECEGMRRGRDIALTEHEAQGGRKQDFNQIRRDQIRDDTLSWFAKVPGLTSEMQLLAWINRGESPLIYATSPIQSAVDGREVRVEMIPRSFWDEDPRFPNIYSENLRGQLRERYGRSTFCPNKQYVRMVSMQDSEGRPARVTTTNYFDDKVVRGAEIVEALTTATKAGDLVDAFAWFETVYSSSDAHDMLQDIRHRAKLLSGCTAQQGSVPVPSRALNNEVACRIFDALNLAFDVCLIGLRGAGHLNGRQGVIHGLDSKNYERWKAQLDDGTYVSVKAINFERIRLGDYKRIFKP